MIGLYEGGGMNLPFMTRLPGSLADLKPIPGVQILGVGHKARHGKDTTCTILHSFLPRTSRILSFADDVKSLARSTYGMTEKDGSLLQQLGQNMREMDQDHWVKCMYWRIQELKPAFVLIPDMRYRNEVALVKQMGGMTLKIERHNSDGSMFIDPTRPARHISETQLDTYTDWDFIIHNDQSYSQLEGAVSSWWSHHSQYLFREKKAA